jgi:hypothetical protein
MTSTRTTARVAGVLYLITFVASIPAVALLAPVLNNPDYILSTGSDTRVTLVGGCLDLRICRFADVLACGGLPAGHESSRLVDLFGAEPGWHL